MQALHEVAARIGLAAAAPFGFVLAGGYAVQAHGFLVRRSEDVDLFTTLGARRRVIRDRAGRAYVPLPPSEARPNERLRALLLENGETPAKLAEALEVDNKTVERWVTRGRVPYCRHRHAVATHFGVDEVNIWPDALDRDQVAAMSESEIVAVYPHRSEVPRDVWGHLFSQAEEEIGVLVYSGLFLAEDTGLMRIFKDRAKAGARIRILLGDPENTVVAERGLTASHNLVWHLRKLAGGELAGLYMESFERVWETAKSAERG